MESTPPWLPHLSPCLILQDFSYSHTLANTFFGIYYKCEPQYCCFFSPFPYFPSMQMSVQCFFHCLPSLANSIQAPRTGLHRVESHWSVQPTHSLSICFFRSFVFISLLNSHVWGVGDVRSRRSMF